MLSWDEHPGAPRSGHARKALATDLAAAPRHSRRSEGDAAQPRRRDEGTHGDELACDLWRAHLHACPLLAGRRFAAAALGPRRTNPLQSAESADTSAAAGVEHDLLLVDSERPTTVKERFVGRAQAKHPSQILRVDHDL